MRFRYCSLITILLLLPFSELSAQKKVRKEQGSQHYVRGKLFFKIAPSSGIDLEEYIKGKEHPSIYNDVPEIRKLLDPYGIQRIHCPFRTKAPAIQHTYAVRFKADGSNKTQGLLEELRSLDYVNYAERAQRYKQFYNPNDVHPKQKWYLDSIKASLAYDTAKGDSNTTIAIVDDAVHIDHPDLQGNVKRNVDEIPGDSVDNDGNGYVDDVHGWDAADNDGDPRPPKNHAWYGLGLPVFTHGTHTSGIASAATDNGTGITGTGFNNSIIPIKVNSDGAANPLGIGSPAEGIDYAIQAGADIISMSFGSTNKDCTVTNMLQTAHNDSIFLVAAAGNNPDWDTAWPAAMDEVFAVGATTFGDSVWKNSTYGTWVDIMAPGTEIYSTLWVGGSDSLTYDTLSGTSMACPMVAGVAGLMISHFAQDNPARIESCLKTGAKNIDSINPNYIDSMGAGRLNAYASLRCASPDTLNMDSSDLDPYNPDTTSGDTTSIRQSQKDGLAAFNVYPNPTRGKVRWEAPKGFRPQSVEILSLRGRSLREVRLSNDRKGVIEMGGLSEGLYLLRFHGVDGKQSIRKLSVRR